MNDLRNPYIAGAPVVETSMFFGRADVFKWIENSLTGKYVDHILVLHGQRRVGKTTVLKQIPNFLSGNYIQVFFDLQGRTNTTLDRFLWWMASEIIRTLNKVLDADLPRIARDQFSDPDTFITDFIPSLHPVLGDHTLLFTFDEFDTLAREDIQEKLARPLITFFRRLFEVEGLNFIFSIGSSGNKLENMQAAYTNFFKTALYRKVSFLTKSDCLDLITKPVADVITYHPKAVQRIIEITSGHPYFTQLTCHELFSQCQSTGSRKINIEDVDNILDDVIERGTVNLKFVWDEATDLEKWILAVLGMDEGLNQRKIAQVLKSQGVRFSDANLNAAILHLRDKDVLTKDNHLMIHLMKLWLELNRPMDRVREELVQTNPIADRYLEIGDEYRERGNQEQALSNYQRALEVQANNMKALYHMGAIYLDQGKYQLAASSFEKALQVDSEHIAARQGFCKAHLALGDQARKTNHITEAIEAYQTILNITPVHAHARGNLAAIYREQAEAFLSSGSDQQALAQFQLAIEMTPEDEFLMARYQQILDQKKAALVKSWMDKAERALRRQRWDEAGAMAQEALKIDPDNPSLQIRVAEIKDAPRQQKLKTYQREVEAALSKGDYPKAIQSLEKAIMLAPEDESLTARLGSTRADHLNAQLKQYETQAKAAQAAGNWEAALAARNAALQLDPENKSLLTALEETKAAQHQAKLNALQEEVDSARREKRWDEAILAAEKLIALAPEDDSYQTLVDDIKAAQRQALLDELQEKFHTARQAERWEEAIQAAEKLVELAPEDPSFQTLVDNIKTDQRQAMLDELQEQVNTARQAKRWDEAIQAAEKLVELAPEDDSYQSLVDDLQASQRQAKLEGLLHEARSALEGEQWAAAVSALEAYLKEAPEDREKVEVDLAKARKYAQISEDYNAAQEMINKRQFNKAVPLLQGIIAQDPTYKSTSRLLVEAVEARGQRKPIRINPKLWIPVGAVAVIVALGLIFSDQIRGWFSARSPETPISAVETPEDNSNDEAAEEPAITPKVTEGTPTEETEELIAPTPTVDEESERISQLYNAAKVYMAETTPTTEDDFETRNYDWGAIQVFDGLYDNDPIDSYFADYFQNGQLQFTGDLYKIANDGGGQLIDFNANNFILKYSLSPQAGLDTFKIAIRGTQYIGIQDPYLITISGLLQMDMSLGGMGAPGSEQQSNENYIELLTTKGTVLGKAPFDLSEMSELLIIAENNIVAVFVDGNLIVYDTSEESEGAFNVPIYEIVSNVIDEDLIYIDDFRFWNLDGFDHKLLETVTEETQTEPTATPTSQDTSESEPYMASFVNPILDYIVDRPPDVEDDFSTDSGIWSESEEPNATKEILDNQLHVNYSLSNLSINSYEYVLEVDVKPRASHATWEGSGFSLYNGNTLYINYLIRETGRWKLTVPRGGDTYLIYEYGQVSQQPSYKLKVIIKGSQIAFLVDGEVVAYYYFDDWRLYRGSNPIVSLDPGGNWYFAYFDNFKAWDLTNYDLPSN